MQSDIGIILFDVEVTTCVALFLTNILYIRPLKNVTVPKLVKSEPIRYHFTEENINFTHI